MLTWITDTFWKFVFWWKKRTGFIYLGPVVAVGTVVSLRSSNDGDALLNINLDKEYLWLTPKGIGRRRSIGKLHCEIPPWVRGRVREVYSTLKEGDRVSVSGEWGFDGVHVIAEYPPWYMFPIELLMAVFRHQPNVQDGWFEIHPVENLEKL